jgi:hypothetical protein
MYVPTYDAFEKTQAPTDEYKQYRLKQNSLPAYSSRKYIAKEIPSKDSSMSYNLKSKHLIRDYPAIKTTRLIPSYDIKSKSGTKYISKVQDIFRKYNSAKTYRPKTEINNISMDFKTKTPIDSGVSLKSSKITTGQQLLPTPKKIASKYPSAWPYSSNVKADQRNKDGISAQLENSQQEIVQIWEEEAKRKNKALFGSPKISKDKHQQYLAIPKNIAKYTPAWPYNSDQDTVNNQGKENSTTRHYSPKRQRIHTTVEIENKNEETDVSPPTPNANIRQELSSIPDDIVSKYTAVWPYGSSTATEKETLKEPKQVQERTNMHNIVEDVTKSDKIQHQHKATNEGPTDTLYGTNKKKPGRNQIVYKKMRMVRKKYRPEMDHGSNMDWHCQMYAKNDMHDVEVLTPYGC